MRRALLALLGALALSGCDSAAPPSDPGTAPDTTFSRLFEAPTATEVAAVRAEFVARDAERSQRYLVTPEDTLTVGGVVTHVYAVRDRGTNAVLAYGAVRLPVGRPGEVERRPVLLVLPEDGEVNLTEAVETLPFSPTLRDDYVYAVLAYRGRPLRVGSRTFTSPADPRTAYDLDPDDALALLGAVRSREPLVAPAEVGVMGYGRGATAALLAEARPSTHGVWDLIVALAGPSDFFLPHVRDAARRYVAGAGAGRLPAFGDVAETVLAPHRAGTLSLTAARRALLRRSPLYFVAPRPFTVSIYSSFDLVVPVEHGDVLRAVLVPPNAVYLRVSEPSHSSLPSDAEVVGAVTSLLRQRLPR